MAAMTLPMVPPSFGYGRSDRRTPPESSVLRTTRGLKPHKRQLPISGAKCTDMPHSAWLHSATNPSGSASCQDLLPCGSPSFGSPWPDDGWAYGLRRTRLAAW
jgi:hypothetical protein